jgi:hypothetical protein
MSDLSGQVDRTGGMELSNGPFGDELLQRVETGHWLMRRLAPAVRA